MANIQKTVYISEQLDPAYNLAVEEWLMEICAENEIILYLWQNKNTVVIGKHQNPYKECSINRMNQDNVTLVRRISGGGAVYHDLGNLNFTFIASEKYYDVQNQLKVVLKSIKEFGIIGEFTGRNDLTIDGKKFSGNAFANKKSIYCHHGTLLVDVALEKLVSYLTPSEIKIISKGIESIRSRVVNLIEYSPSITIPMLKKSLQNAFSDSYEGEIQVMSLPKVDSSYIKPFIEKYKTWQWNFGESPKCEISHKNRYSWGVIEFGFTIKDGKITECLINTDSLVLEDFNGLRNALIQKEANAKEIVNQLSLYIADEEILRDLTLFIQSIFGCV